MEIQREPQIRSRCKWYIPFFIDPRGGGYVKIEQGLDGEIKFLEHVGIGLTTFTYFGQAKSFAP